jgi:uncharacterized protein (DUF488 family)
VALGMSATVSTFGYAGLRGADDLRELLGDEIDLVIDVRLRVWSGTRTWSTGTAATVEAAGYRYLWLPEAGNRAYRTPGAVEIADMKVAIEMILDRVAAGDRVALMCVCRDVRTCHRLVLADELQRRVPDLAVVHRGGLA